MENKHKSNVVEKNRLIEKRIKIKARQIYQSEMMFSTGIASHKKEEAIKSL